MRKFIVLPIIGAALSFSTVSYAEESALCYAPYWGGLLSGDSREREALKLYGEGLYRDYGYGRVRFYYDQSGEHTLALYFGTDNFVTDIFVHEGVVFPNNESVSDINPYKNTWFDPTEGFGKWHKLKVGSTQSDAIKWLGEPNKRISENEWEYLSKCSCELPSGISVYFENNRLISVRFWAAQG